MPSFNVPRSPVYLRSVTLPVSFSRWAAICALTICALTSALGCGARSNERPATTITSPAVQRGAFASSRDHLSEERSSLVINEPGDAVSKYVVVAFARRGFTLFDKQTVSRSGGGTLLKFKGSRTRSLVTTTPAVPAREVGTTDVGSVFYVRVEGRAAGTALAMLGKPTVDGRDVCSRSDEASPTCDGVLVDSKWVGWRHTTGKEEAEVIRGVLLEIGIVGSAQEPPAADERNEKRTPPSQPIRPMPRPKSRVLEI